MQMSVHEEKLLPKLFVLKMRNPYAPWYEEILLPMDFGRLPLQSYCEDPYSPILMIHGAYERRGMELCSVGRNKSFATAYEKPRGRHSSSVAEVVRNP